MRWGRDEVDSDLQREILRNGSSAFTIMGVSVHADPDANPLPDVTRQGVADHLDQEMRRREPPRPYRFDADPTPIHNPTPQFFDVSNIFRPADRSAFRNAQAHPYTPAR
jgi:hypothetical protein